MSIAIPPSSPIRERPVISNNIRDRPRSPPPRSQRPYDDSERYITPATSSPRQHHQRNHSATPADLDRLAVSDRDRRERQYRGSGAPGPRAYPAGGALVRYNDNDVSYTGPREQFDRDYPSQPLAPVRRESLPRRERPNSALDFADWKPPPSTRRDAGPPPSAARQFERLEKSDPSRAAIRSSGGGGSDNERDSDLPRRRNTTRAPVSLHQDRDIGPPPRRDNFDDRRDSRPRRDRREDDDTYASDRDHRDHQLASNHHERRHRKHRENSPEVADVVEKVAAVGLGGAAVGLAGVLSKKSRNNDNDEEEEHQKERRRRRHRDNELDDGIVAANESRPLRPHETPQDPQDDRDINGSRHGKAPRDRADSDSQNDEDPHRRRRHRRHRNKDDIRPEGDSGSGSDARNSFDRPREEVGRDGPGRGLEADGPDRRTRDRDRDRRDDRDYRDHSIAEQTGYSGPPGEDEEGRPRRVQLVEPIKEKEPEVKPRGILKPARQVPFPEDPNPTREGVAPLKEAGKKGIPPGARWTKINRMLVNPAALEALHERFEERDEYVIVLRVLTREEIEKFAELTAEIRGTHSGIYCLLLY